MRLVITGGRDYKDWHTFKDVLDKLDPNFVYVGDSPTGVDKMVSDWCDHNEVSYRIFTADWTKFGKLAGPIRNEEMLRKAGEEALVVVFPGGHDNNCANEARRLDMIVMRVEA
jgi:hypothetical protein